MLFDCINENFHRENLISETTLGYLSKAQQLQTGWRQKAQEKVESIKRLTKLNWDSYWADLVKPHSQCMTLKCIINSAEKIVPALADSVFTRQLKSEVGQPPLLKSMLNACKFKYQIHKQLVDSFKFQIQYQFYFIFAEKNDGHLNRILHFL